MVINSIDRIGENPERKDIVFQDGAHRWITLKRFFDDTKLYKVLVTADERIGKVDDGLRGKVKQHLEKLHPGYSGVAIIYH